MSGSAPADVFADLVGQPEAVDVLRAAAASAADVLAGRAGTPGAMTHAWLFTGPPGSGRSVAARAFAAALQCPRGGCADCRECHTVLAGTHADVLSVVPEGLSISVRETRELVTRAALSPAGGRWQVVVIEDADRLTEQASNALLKAVEEPAPRSVFLLCAPSTHPDDVSVTIRSRCRVVALRTPSAAAVAEMLERRDGVDAAMAAWAARAAQGHVGRARRLARDEDARQRRRQVLELPRALVSGGVGAAFDAADALVGAAADEAGDATTALDASELEALKQALGAGGTGRGAAAATRWSAGAVKELERRQKSRATRAQRDALDRALVDLTAFYRDVLARQLAADVPAVHGDAADVAARAAQAWTPESTLRRIEAVLACREAIDANVKPLIAVEAMALALRTG